MPRTRTQSTTDAEDLLKFNCRVHWFQVIW